MWGREGTQLQLSQESRLRSLSLKRNYFPDTFCCIFSPESIRKFGVPLPKAAERTSCLDINQTGPSWIFLAKKGWPELPLRLCCAMLNRLNNLGLLLWTSLLSLFRHGHWQQRFTVFTGEPSRNPAGKKPPDFYHIFALCRAEVTEVKNKNTATEKTKCFSLNFSDGKCSAVSVAQSSHSYK